LAADGAGNALHGQCIAIDTRESTLYTSGPLVAALGVEHLVVVATPDAILVCPRDRVQEIRSVVSALSAQNLEAHL
jgi:hypothetical protein